MYKNCTGTRMLRLAGSKTKKDHIENVDIRVAANTEPMITFLSKQQVKYGITVC